MNPLDIVFIHEVIFPIFGFILGGGAIVGLYRTINRHLERQHQKQLAAGGPEALGELERLRQRVQQLEEQDHRLEELEERLDFAERVLAQRDDARGALPEGG